MSLCFAAPAAKAGKADNIARYRQERLGNGARTLPVPARIAYGEAITEIRKGDFDRAEMNLHRALSLQPDYPDPYFTLAGLKARQLDLEALVYITQALSTAWRNFTVQRLLVLNAVIIIPYVLFLVAMIVCFAFAIKYLPFASHKLTEFLREKLKAAAPSLSSYLLLLLPLVIVPGVITALAYLTVVCWSFMRRRERALVVSLMVPFVIIGFGGWLLGPLTPLADPGSLTALLARTTYSAQDDHLVRQLERAGVKGLEAEQYIGLGLMHQKSGRYAQAADYFFRAISLAPDNAMGYINLGNVYFLQGQYEKALEGYRKAENIDPTDPVCQYDLAQAYIKVLLMKESSRALQQASALGISTVKASYTPRAIEYAQVFPKTFSNSQLWHIARAEGESAPGDVLDELMLPFTRFPRRTSAWILLASILAAVVLGRAARPSRLTFQCSNCGRLTCTACCSDERDMNICQECADAIKGITSEKVIDALLRRRRQTVLVSRRRSARLLTVLFPGVRDVSYGRISRGVFLGGMFSIGVVQFFARGFIIKDPSFLVDELPLWKTVLPVAAIVIPHLVAVFTGGGYDLRAFRNQNGRQRGRDIKGDRPRPARVA